MSGGRSKNCTGGGGFTKYKYITPLRRQVFLPSSWCVIPESDSYNKLIGRQSGMILKEETIKCNVLILGTDLVST